MYGEDYNAAKYFSNVVMLLLAFTKLNYEVWLKVRLQ